MGVLYVGARKCQEHKPYITKTHTKRETKIYEARKDVYVSEAEERDLYMIYTKL